jgi:hypothetical protein
VDPIALLARPPVRLFLTATSLLFVELLLIRWIPANVIYVGYFRNFLLMASFLGIGVGILWAATRSVSRCGVVRLDRLAIVLPSASLLLDPPWLRYVIAAALAFAPILFANLVFSYSFRDTKSADMAFASNLLGAVVGGAVEYVALVTGYSALLFVVGGLYLLAWALASGVRLLADVGLGGPDEASAPSGSAGPQACSSGWSRI